MSAVSWRRSGRVATLELDRPPLHVLDLAALGELDRCLGELAELGGELQVVVLRSTGERAFSAGVAVEDHTPERIDEMLDTFHAALGRLAALEPVTVALVHGHCLGGGLELAAACDWLLAAESARLGQPEIALGCFPPWGAAAYPRRIGHAAALELLVGGEAVSAAEAHRLGLVTHLAPDDALEARLDELVGRVTRHSAAVTRLAKRAVRAGSRLPFPRALAEAERLYREELTATDDMEEGLAAFVEKREPEWNHR